MRTTNKRRTGYQRRGSRKHLANPTVDVICVVVLVVILLLAPYIHLSTGL